MHQVARYDHERGISYWTKNYRTGVESGDELALERQYEYYDPIYVLPEAGQAWWRAHADASVSAVGLSAPYRTVSGPWAAKLTRRPAVLGWAVLLVSHRPLRFGRVPVIVMTAVPLPVAPANAPVLLLGSTV